MFFESKKLFDIPSNDNNSSVESKVIDEEKPVITLVGKESITIAKNKQYEEEGYSAYDNIDKDITSDVIVDSTVDTSKSGSYQITYTVKDKAGNSASAYRYVKVVDFIYGEDTKYPKGNGYDEVIEGLTYIKDILIVNKTYKLPSDYAPGVPSDVYSALQALVSAAKNAGYSMPIVSGYRTYSQQKAIYENNLNTYTYAETDTFSARPGHSEHQTGLAFDVGQIDYSFGQTERGKWLNNNCHKYGFIIRYPQTKEDITGYRYEPWHIRYVGVEAATTIMTNSITLEEYLELA